MPGEVSEADNHFSLLLIKASGATLISTKKYFGFNKKYIIMKISLKCKTIFRF